MTTQLRGNGRRFFGWMTGLATLIALLVLTPAAPAGENPTDHLFPARLLDANTQQFLIFRTGGGSNGSNQMLGVLDAPTYRRSTEQALFPWFHDREIPPKPGGFEWGIRSADRFYPFDTDGDGTDEVLAYNGSTEIAILDGVPGRLGLESDWTSGRVLGGPAGN